MIELDHLPQPSTAPAPNGTALPSSGLLPTPRRRPPRRARAMLLIGAVLLLGVAVAVLAVRWSAPAPASDVMTPTSTVPAPRLTARGELHPIAEARIGTLIGGVVQSISVEVGQRAGQEQEVARIRGANGTDVLTAPWTGMITGVPVHGGDTVLAGTTIARIGDLSRLQVETTDVDEFVIAHVAAGQPVQVAVDALDGRAFAGTVRTVALQQETNKDGDEHYPVVIDLNGATPEFRPGMSVRVDFAHEQPSVSTTER
jgi:multidrug efflux pump subunit AcrA (membrane-fusion protein)